MEQETNFPAFGRFGRFCWRVTKKLVNRKVAISLMLLCLFGYVVCLTSSCLEKSNLQEPFVKVELWNKKKYKSKKNPFKQYESAMKSLTEEDSNKITDWNQQRYWTEKGIPFPSWTTVVKQSEAEQILKRIQPIIKKVELGASLNVNDFQFVEKKPDISTIFPEYAQLRGLARAISADAAHKTSQGRYDEAIGELLAGNQMGNGVSRSPLLIGGLVGYAIRAISTKPLFTMMSDEKLSPAQYQKISLGLEKIDQDKQPFKEIMKGEYAFSRESIIKILWGKWPTGMFGQEDAWGERLIKVYINTPGMKTRTIRNYDKYWKIMIDNLEKPYIESSKLEIANQIPITDILNRMLFPVFSQAERKDIETRVIALGLATMAAVEGYKKETGSYPDNLNQLVEKGYLTQAPKDPFSGKANLIYKRKKQGSKQEYLLYSIGADCVDDGGKIVRPYWEIGSMADEKGNLVTGDIVFYPGLDIWKRPELRHSSSMPGMSGGRGGPGMAPGRSGPMSGPGGRRGPRG